MEINKKQKIILYVVIVIILAMLLFPPFHFTRGNGGSLNCDYSFIALPYNSKCRVDIATLLIQWAGVLIAGGLAFFAVKGKKD